MQHVENPEARVSLSGYRSELALWGTVGAPNIITMEDDSDDSDDSDVISNSDPIPLLFFLLTGGRNCYEDDSDDNERDPLLLPARRFPTQARTPGPELWSSRRTSRRK